MSRSPSPNGGNGGGRRMGGRDAHGRFGPGNPGGPGNPLAKKAGLLRAALIAAVTEDDIRAIAKALVREARSGNIQAAREVLDRCLGRPVEVDLIERLERLESAWGNGQDAGGVVASTPR